MEKKVRHFGVTDLSIIARPPQSRARLSAGFVPREMAQDYEVFRIIVYEADIAIIFEKDHEISYLWICRKETGVFVFEA